MKNVNIKDYKFDLSKLSSVRGILMGFAILWVVVFHACFDTKVIYSYYPFIKVLFCIGNMGVEIFLLLSGFGIYCSLNKNNNEISFYKKRLKRLLPVIPISCLVIIVSFFQNKTITLPILIGCFLQENYWVSEKLVSYSFWYISMVIVCYIVSPNLYNIINQLTKHKRNLFLLLTIPFILTIPFFNSYISMAVGRFPIYVLGMVLGYLFCNNIKIDKKYIIISYLLASISFALIICTSIYKYDFGICLYFAYYFIAFSICIIVSEIQALLRDNIIVKNINKIFLLLGSCSLEIYLMDAFWVHQFKDIRVNIPFSLLICISLISGICYHFMYKYGISLLLKKDKS